jgi:hypothetical protein
MEIPALGATSQTPRRAPRLLPQMQPPCDAVADSLEPGAGHGRRTGIPCADNDRVDSSARTARPNSSAFHYGPGHMIMHGNQAFLDEFGPGCVGQPAREVMLDLPAEAFDLMDLVYREGRPFARRIATPGGERRLVVAPRRDPENGQTYGVVSHLRPATEPSARSS